MPTGRRLFFERGEFVKNLLSGVFVVTGRIEPAAFETVQSGANSRAIVMLIHKWATSVLAIFGMNNPGSRQAGLHAVTGKHQWRLPPGVRGVLHVPKSSASGS